MSYFNTEKSTQFTGAVRVSDSAPGVTDGNLVVDRQILGSQGATIGGTTNLTRLAPLPVTSVNATTTLPSSLSCESFVLCGNNVANYAVTLPAAVNGFTFWIVNLNSQSVTSLVSNLNINYEQPVGVFLTGNAVNLATNTFVQMYSDGTSWTLLINTGIYSTLGRQIGVLSHFQYHANTNTVECDCGLQVDNDLAVLGSSSTAGTSTLLGDMIANATHITPVELSYVHGTTSNIQNQLNSKIGPNLLVISTTATLANNLADGTLVYLNSTGGYTVTLNYGVTNGTIMLIANYASSAVTLQRGSTDSLFYLNTAGGLVNANTYSLTRYTTLLAYYVTGAWYLMTDILGICGLIGAANTWTATNTFNGQLRTSNSMSGSFPPANTAFGTISANYTGGSGEIDFFSDYVASGSSAPAFHFYRNGNGTPLLAILGDGTSTHNGPLIAASNVTLGTTTAQTTTVNSNISANSQVVTPTQLGYVSGATSNIQTQLNNRAQANPIIVNANTTLSQTQPHGTWIRAKTGGITITFNTAQPGGYEMWIANDTGSNITLSRGGTETLYCYRLDRVLINLNNYTFPPYASACFKYSATDTPPGWVMYHDITSLCAYVGGTNNYSGANNFQSTVTFVNGSIANAALATGKLSDNNTWTGTNTYSNALITTQNSGGSFPATGNFGSIGGNYSGGAGEMNFYSNYTASGSNATAFSFLRNTVTTPLLAISANGIVTSSGYMTAGGFSNTQNAEQLTIFTMNSGTGWYYLGGFAFPSNLGSGTILLVESSGTGSRTEANFRVNGGAIIGSFITYTQVAQGTTAVAVIDNIVLNFGGSAYGIYIHTTTNNINVAFRVTGGNPMFSLNFSYAGGSAPAGTALNASTNIASAVTISGISCINSYGCAVNTTTQSISSGSATTLAFTTVEFDNGSAYNTGTGGYTAPVNGKYQVDLCVSFASASWSATNELSLHLRVNGVDKRETISIVQANTTMINSIQMSTIIPLTLGDVLDAQVFQNTGGSRSLSGSTLNYIQIAKIG